MQEYPDAKPVNGRGGDEGVDTFVGDFGGRCHIFQHKYFPNRLAGTQRRQVEASLHRALSRHQVEKWTLVVPIDLNPAELKWLQRLEAGCGGVEVDWWGKTKLLQLLASHPEIAKEFQLEPTVTLLLAGTRVSISAESEETIAAVSVLLVRAVGVSSGQPPKDVIDAVATDIVTRAKLKVLVLGPGQTGGALYQKRCAIRDELRRLGHDADFCEDIWSAGKLSGSGLNLSVAELVTARSYDYIVCLMAGPGVIGEVHEFAARPELASKMLVCVDQIHQSGYSAQGILRILEGANGRLDWFQSPTDIDECYLLGRVLEQVQKVADRKQWVIANGGGRP